MSRLTISNLTFPRLGDDELSRVAAALGFAGVDFIDVVENGDSYVGIPYDDAAAARREAQRLRALYRDAGLPLTDFYPVEGAGGPPPINTPSEEGRRRARAWFERTLELACELGARGLTVAPGIEWDEEDPETSLVRSAEELAWRVAKGAEVEMAVSAEPVADSVIRRPAAALALLDQLPELTLTLDHSHFVYGGYTDRECEPLLARARHLHCRGAAPGHLQQPLATSTIDFDRLAELLVAQGYDGFICVEFFAPGGAFELDPVDIWTETITLRDEIAAAFAAHGGGARAT